VSTVVDLSPQAIDAVARRVIELQRSAPIVEADQWLSKTEAAKYLSFTSRTFDRKRKIFVEALKPAMDHPQRWSRNALDVFKFTRGAPQLTRNRRIAA
jgi:hypothetical protein